MLIRDWSSDVRSADLIPHADPAHEHEHDGDRGRDDPLVHDSPWWPESDDPSLPTALSRQRFPLSPLGWSWRAGLARSGHAEHRQPRAAGYVAGAAPAMPGRLVAERNGRRMGTLEQTGREVGRGNARLAKGLAPGPATETGHERGLCCI